jgi:hypothetical protein
MRDSFNLNLKEDARVKFVYTSPELNQNIEISLDGDEASVEALVDAFQRFLGALGLPLPEGVYLAFIEADEDEENEQEEENSDN